MARTCLKSIDISDTILLVLLTYCYINADDENRILPLITALKCRLADFTEPDYGLPDELLRLDVLNHRECADVRSERTVYRRNDALLDLLQSEEQCVKFLKALERTGQQHVANYVTQNGGGMLKTSVKCSTW